jgi:hypothetical protein
MRKRLKHIRSIAKWWWALVAALWSTFWIADGAIGKWGSQTVKAWWDAHTEHLPTNWQAWLIGLLGIALLLILEGSYRRSVAVESEHKSEVRHLSDKVTDVPLLRVAEDGFCHDLRPLVNTDNYGNKNILATLSCIHVKFKNDPKKTTPNSRAKVLAEMEFYDANSGAFLCQMYGRWGDSTQPPHLAPGQTVSDNLAAVDFEIGQERELNIAFKYQQESDCFGMSNKTYEVYGWRHPKQGIPCEHVRVRVRLRGVGVNSSWDFWFQNPKTGQLQPIKQQQVQPVAP